MFDALGMSDKTAKYVLLIMRFFAFLILTHLWFCTSLLGLERKSVESMFPYGVEVQFNNPSIGWSFQEFNETGLRQPR